MPQEPTSQEKSTVSSESKPHKDKSSYVTTFPSHWFMMLCVAIILALFLWNVIPFFKNAIVRIWNLM